MTKVLFFLLGLFVSLPCSSQYLSGTVNDQKGEPLPFVNIYVNGTSSGTTSNYEGAFKLKVGSEPCIVIFQYIGFQKHREEVHIASDQSISVTMLPQVIQLAEVTVSGDEDPAYAIIRKAIEKRKFHLNQVQSYRCEAYVKGLMRITNIPEKIFGIKTGIKANEEKDQIVYLSESESILNFEKPDRIKETVVSSKVSGDDQGFSWNSASDFYFDFYKNNIAVEQISERVLISPIASNAFLFYRYEFLGTFEDEGVLINKIKVLPRRESDPVFAGILNIVENRWNIHSLDLFITKANQLNFLDTLRVEQYFLPVKGIYMPISQRFEFNYSFLKVEGDGYYVGIFKNYDVNLEFKPRFFTNEIIKIEEGANERDAEYWSKVRPIPLTKIEERDYVVKDSMALIRESPAYKDSVDRAFNQFSPFALLGGYTYNNSKKNLSVTTSSLINVIQFNTVEGANLHLKADIRKRYEDERRLRISPHIRYGFSNRHLNGYFDVGYMRNQKTLETFWLKAGTFVYQFNEEEPISELINTAYTLIGEKNYMKLYEKYFAEVKYRRELTAGIVMVAEAEWSRRVRLKNTSLYSFKKSENESGYTSNDPELISDAYVPMANHNAFDIELGWRFRFGEKYITRPTEKIRMGSRFPVIGVRYKKSFRIGRFSSLNFDFAEVSLSDELPLALFGTTIYSASVGGFLNSARVELPDYKHFSGNQTIFGRNYGLGFQLLEYYDFSTSDWFAEAHLEHYFNGFIFNKIPFVRKLRLQAVAGAHFLYNPQLKPYAEFNLGIENILRFLRVDVIASLQRNEPAGVGFRLGLDLGVLN